MKYKVNWDNSRDCGTLPGEYTSKKAALRAGRDWKRDMILVDNDPKIARSLYYWEIVEVEEPQTFKTILRVPTKHVDAAWKALWDISGKDIEEPIKVALVEKRARSIAVTVVDTTGKGISANTVSDILAKHVPENLGVRFPYWS